MTFQEWQRGLIVLGYDLGKGGPSGKGDDGIPGRKSIEATIAFKKARGLSPTPAIGPKSLEYMREALLKFRGPDSTAVQAQAVRRAITTSGPRLEPVWVIESRRWIGEAEVPGKGSNPRLLKAIQAVGAKVLGINYTDDDSAWCGAIMAVWLGQTLPSEPLPSIAVRASSWSSFGVKLETPALGAIMVFSRKGGGHVGLYLGETATHYVILGGNQGNRVSIMTRAKGNDLQAMRWPRTVPLPTGGRVMTNAAGIPSGLSEA